MDSSTTGVPLLDLFGEQVIIQPRVIVRRPRSQACSEHAVQLGFIELLEMSDTELEVLRTGDEITDDYIEWLRGYLLKLTLRQILHPQVSDATRAEGMAWLMSDDRHPFSFRTCCAAWDADHEEVRAGTLRIIALHQS